MKFLTSFAIAVVLLMNSATAQTGFEKIHAFSDNHIYRNCVETADGDYLLTGTRFTKLNAQGDTLWTKPLPLWNITPVSNGDFIAVGGSLLYRIDADGTVLWQSQPMDIVRAFPTSDGGYVVLPGYGISITKLDANGNFVWTSQELSDSIEGDYQNDVVSVVETSDGGFILCGQDKGYAHTDLVYAKISSTGQTLWRNSIGEKYEENFAVEIVRTTDGNVMLAANMDSLGAVKETAMLLKMDEDGNTIWQKFYLLNDKATISALVALGDGNYAITGFTGTYLSSSLVKIDAFMAKINAGGNMVWSQEFGNTEFDVFYDIISTSDGGFLAVGSYDRSFVGFNEFSKGYAVKTDAHGNITGLTETYTTGNITFYPNPTSDYITIEADLLLTPYSLLLTDLTGREVRRLDEVSETRYALPLNGIDAGVYIYRLIGHNGESLTGKMVVR